MKKYVTLLFFWLLLLPAFAQRDICPRQFVAGIAPQILNSKMAASTTLLCFNAYALMYSGISRTPLWSAEHLHENGSTDLQSPKRRNAFHAEPRLPRSERSELRDYAHSGFDRGHMTPSGDMPTPQAQYESFSLANIVPQNPESNQQLGKV